jgi:UDP-N-acetylglucosamine/UDP-N-acetylgalactosamine 4-epimerase
MQNKTMKEVELDQIKGMHVLVTGGAGFIGSNIVESLLKNGVKVSVLDNLSTGKLANIVEFQNNSNFKFIEGDIFQMETCLDALSGVDLVCHQAALGSVPRSIEFPHKTHEVNATGFLNMLHAAKTKNIKRFVFASSSSVYGDSMISPKVVGQEGNLLSPYAVTKQLNEQYAKVYAQLHGMETIGLRYFNIFGPKQDPNGVYAAAIPKFIAKLQNNEEVLIHGDGMQTRDFTYVKNAVNANFLSLFTGNKEATGKVYNVACGDSFSLIQVVDALKSGLKSIGLNSKSEVIFGPERAGDIKHSLADISDIASNLSYAPLYSFQEGIDEYIESMK